MGMFNAESREKTWDNDAMEVVPQIVPEYNANDARKESKAAAIEEGKRGQRYAEKMWPGIKNSIKTMALKGSFKTEYHLGNLDEVQHQAIQKFLETLDFTVDWSDDSSYIIITWPE